MLDVGCSAPAHLSTVFRCTSCNPGKHSANPPAAGARSAGEQEHEHEHEQDCRLLLLSGLLPAGLPNIYNPVPIAPPQISRTQRVRGRRETGVGFDASLQRA